MSQLRLNQLPDGSGSLSNDDIFIFMDDPSGSGVTKKISLNQISNAIGGGGGNPFDQNLNTSDDPTFTNLNFDNSEKIVLPSNTIVWIGTIVETVDGPSYEAVFFIPEANYDLQTGYLIGAPIPNCEIGAVFVSSIEEYTHDGIDGYKFTLSNNCALIAWPNPTWHLTNPTFYTNASSNVNINFTTKLNSTGSIVRDNNSGDGNNKGTFKIIPDNSLLNTDQYLIVDPTGPDHIHLRAGGTQDNSAAELIIGGEYAHVNITDYNHQVNIRTDSGEIDTTINLGLPYFLNGNNFATEFIPPHGSTITVGDVVYTVTGSWDNTHGGEDKGINLSPSTPILEYGNYPIHLASIPKSWTFQNDGNLSIPGNIQLSNGTSLAKGTYDNATSGNNGISLNCAIGYELNWQGGHLKSTSNNGTFLETLNIDSNINITTSSDSNLRICHGSNGDETFISSSGTILNGLLIIKNMPTSDPISSGAIWNSGGILAISNG